MSCSSRLVVLIGASGRIGTGFVKASLGCDKHALKIVGVFRNDESAEKTNKRLGNPPSSKFVPIVGSLASEKDAVELRKKIEDTYGEITDVIASIGRGVEIDDIFDQSLENFRDFVSLNKLEPHFCAAKAFIPYLCDRSNTSYTFINGATAVRPLPNGGNMSVAYSAQAKFTKAIMTQYDDKSIRINELLIACATRAWDNLPPGAVSNIDMGKSILGILVHPVARSLSMLIYKGNLDQIAQTGRTENVCNVLLYF